MTDNAGDIYYPNNDTTDNPIYNTFISANCLSCGITYDHLTGHICPNNITTSGTTVTGGYCDKCTLWYQGSSHTCDTPFTIQPLLGLERRYFFHMKDLV